MNNCNYYKQWTNNFEYSVSDSTTPAAPTLSCNSLGSPAMLTLTTSYQAFYCDNGAAATATNPTTGSTGSQRWSDNGQSFTVSAGGANDIFAYYDQFSVTYAYTVALGGSPTVTNIVTYTQFGAPVNLTPTNGGVSAWTDAGTTSTYTNPIGGGPGERWETGTTSFAISSSINLNPTYTHQYSLTVGGGNGIVYSVSSETGDNFWNAGDSLTVSSNGIWGRGGGTGMRVASWNLDGGANTNVATTGTVTTSSITMSAEHTVNFNDVTQYQLTLNAAATSALVSCTSPTITGDNYWYDSGTINVSCTLNGVYSRVGGMGTRISSYNWDGGANTAESTMGTFTTTTMTISSAQEVNANTVTQFQVTLDSGAISALASITSPTISGDNYWYDSGTSVTVTLNGVYGRGSGTGTRLTGYQINAGSNNIVSTTGTVSSLAAVSISGIEAITTTTVTQYELTLNPAATSALVSCTPPTISGDNYWYDSGTPNVSCTLNGVYGRSGGSGTRVTSYNWDGGANTLETTTGTFATSAQTISATHQVNANIVDQYEVTLDSGAASALASITPPTVAGDNYWYDSGAPVTITLNGVYGRAGGTGTRLSSYSVNGGGPTPVSTTGTVTVLSAISIASPQAVTSSTATQYQLTMDATTTSALSSVTPPTVAGDNYWYDSGTPVTLTLNGIWGRTLITGNRLVSYEVNGGAPTPTATTGPVDVLAAVSMSSAISVTSVSTIQFYLTVTGGNGITYSVSPPITGDVGWYDSGTSLTVSSNGVYDRVAGTGQRVSSWHLDGGANTIVATSGLVVTGLISMFSTHVVTFNSIAQYQVTLDANSAASLSACTSPTLPGDDYWYDSGTPVSCTLNGIYDRALGSGDRLTSYSLNGGASIPVATTGMVMALNVPGIAAPEALTATAVQQYQLVLSVLPPSAGTSSYVTSPSLPGDTGWYDSGTSVSFTIIPIAGNTFGYWLGIGACSYVGTSSTPSLVLTCAASEAAVFEGYVPPTTQAIELQPATSGGAIPTFTIIGCNANPSTIPGDGVPHAMDIDNLCNFTLTITNSGNVRYGFSVGGVFSASSPVETTCLSGSCGTITLTYYEQVDDQFAFTTSDTAAGFTAPTLTCVQLGTSSMCGALSQTPSSYWLDFGSSWGVTNPLAGSSGSERWYTSTAAGTVSSPSLTTIQYVHEYSVTFAVAPAGAGTTTPPAGASDWVGAGSEVALGASASSGYVFSSWNASSGAITFANATSLSTFATIGGPASVTAVFVPNLHTITFVESGLPSGTLWSLSIDGVTSRSTTSSIEVTLPAGVYTWTILSPISGPAGVRYVAQPASGQLTAGESPVRDAPPAQEGDVDISFTTQYYLTVAVASNAAGISLAPASGWYNAGTTQSLNASASPSTYLAFVSWNGAGPGSYSGPDPLAQITLGGPITETANFAPEMGALTFVETGLPQGASWSVTVNGVSQTTSGASITFGNVTVGATAEWVVRSSGSAPETGSVQITSPDTITVSITFTTTQSTVTSTLTTTATTTTPQTMTSTTTSTATTTVVSTSGSTTTVYTNTQNPAGSQIGSFFLVYLLIILILAAAVVVLARLALNRRRSTDA